MEKFNLDLDRLLQNGYFTETSAKHQCDAETNIKDKEEYIKLAKQYKVELHKQMKIIQQCMVDLANTNKVIYYDAQPYLDPLVKRYRELGIIMAPITTDEINKAENDKHLKQKLTSMFGIQKCILGKLKKYMQRKEKQHGNSNS